MRVRWILPLAVALALVGCTDHGSGGPSSAAGRDVKAPISSSPDLETWTRAGKAPSARVTAVIRDDERPCTMIKIGNALYAALWPPRAARETAGVRVDGHLYRFGEPTQLHGRIYDGGPTRTACVARDLWMVLETS